jgi:hypothetical protein
LLSFYLPGQPETFVPVVPVPRDQMGLWPTFDQRYPASSGLIVSKNSKLGRSLPGSFARITFLGRIEAVDGGRNIATFYLFLGERAEVKP